MTKTRKAITTLGTAGGIALGIAGLAACDQATTAGHNWVITPDVALHRQTGKPLITATGQCGNIYSTWISKSPEADAEAMTQGQTLIVNCGSGYPTGTWGLDERQK